MSSALARPLLRQSRAWGRMAARRFESTATGKATDAAKETASKASSTASQYSAKASEYTAKASEYSAKAAQGLSRVTSSAGPVIAGAAKGIADTLGKAGGRTGKLVAFFEKQVPRVVYYSKVGSELAKIVFRGQGMSPPSLQAMQSYWQNVWKSVKNPNALMETASKIAQQPSTVLHQVRNISRAQVITAGVLLAECLGFFTVGEMIGRFKIIGYHGGAHADHH